MQAMGRLTCPAFGLVYLAAIMVHAHFGCLPDVIVGPRSGS